MTPPHVPPLSFGEILDGAFTLYRRNFLRLAGTSVLMMAGMLAAITVLGMAAGAAASVVPASFVTLAISAAVLALATTVWSTLTWQTARAYEGKPAPLGEAIETALIGAMPLLGAGVIVISAVTVAGIVVVIAAVALQVMLEGTGSFALGTVAKPVGVAGVLLVCLLAGALLFAVLPAVVLEEKGPWAALARSVQLARGALPRIAGLLGVAWLIVTLPSIAVLGLTGGFARLAHPERVLALGTGAVVAQQLLSLAVSVLTAPFLPAVLVLLYYDRRVRTEALDVQLAASRLKLSRA